MDRIVLSGIEFRGLHGAFPEERVLGNRFSVDVTLETDLRRAGMTDALDDTVDYGEAYRRILAVGTGESRRLLESLAHRMALSLLEMPGIAAVEIVLRKNHPPVEGVLAFSAVEIRRERDAL